MRITSTRQASRLSGGKGVQRGASGGSTFRTEGARSAGTPRKTATSLAIGGVDALLALQSVGPNGGRRAKAVKRGHSMLDILEDLRLDLLAGNVSEPKLRKLLNLVQDKTDPGSEDHTLANLLDDIELRARVELAKRGLADT
jgi:class II flagellar assembly regulator FliX